MLYSSSIDVDGDVCMAPSLTEVHDNLLGLLGVKRQIVVGTPHSQVLNLIPVRRLVVTCNQTYHFGVICNLYYGVAAMNRSTVMGQQGVEKRAQHTAFRPADVQSGSGGGVIV